MNIYWSYTERKIIQSIYSKNVVNSFTWVLRDYVAIDLFVVTPQISNTQPYIIGEIPDGFSFKISGKKNKFFKDNPLLCDGSWTQHGTGEDTYYETNVRLDNNALVPEMGETSELDLIGELARTRENENYDSTRFNLKIISDIIRLSDVCPTPVEYSSSSSLSSLSSSSSSFSSLSSVSSYSSSSSASSVSSLSSSSVSSQSSQSSESSSATSTSSSESWSTETSSSTSQSSLSSSSISSISSLSSSSISSISSSSSLSSLSSSSLSSVSSPSSVSSTSSKSSPSSLSSSSVSSVSSVSSESSYPYEVTYCDGRFSIFPRTEPNIVLDNKTGRYWTKDANIGGTMSQGAAVTYCDNLTVDGVSDWKLTNGYWGVRELASPGLLDTPANDPALPLGHPFDNVQSAHYWSDGWVDGSQYWYINAVDGSLGYAMSPIGKYVWATRITVSDVSSTSSPSSVSSSSPSSSPSSPSSDIPAPPTGLTAVTAMWDVHYADLHWNGSTHATSYEVWKNTVNNSATATKWATPGGTSAYFDCSPDVQMTNYFWVKAVSGSGTSGFSSVASCWIK